MNVQGKPQRTIWRNAPNDKQVHIIDQTLLPHVFRIRTLSGWQDARDAIVDMLVRGAPLIGAAAAYGMALAAETGSGEEWKTAAKELKSSRPTAVNLSWAVNRLEQRAGILDPAKRAWAAWREADAIAEEEVRNSEAIGRWGLELLRPIAKVKGKVNILTHCNAGWLAAVDHGTATAPIYAAQAEGISVHVWVDETRPRNQGAFLTAWELGQQGVPHTVIADNAGGHLMQHGEVDIVIVGADRVTRKGDVANKIGTYLKALSARDNGIPFHVALPSSSIDMSLGDGLAEIPIEERNQDELHYISGLHEGKTVRIRLTPDGSPGANPGFDVTPARLISGFITEKGLCTADERALAALHS